MSVATVARPAVKQPAVMRWHRVWITAGALAAVALAVTLLIYGFGYYILSSTERVASAKHAALKPSGTIGHALGIAGGVLLMLMYLYPLRKRWKWLAKKGKTKNWLDCHILMGLVAPGLVTFHSSFKLHGIAGAAWWVMMSVVASGIVGRYFYSRIPRKLDAVELSFDDLAQLFADLSRQVEAQRGLSRDELRPLLALPSIEEVQAMPLLRALVMIISLDLRRSWQFWRLRARIAHNSELKQALAIVKRQAALSKDALFLSKMHQLFHLWHVIHRPFSYSLALLATLHILVVIFLGYY